MKNVSDYVNIGDVINVEILDVDESLGQLKLSIKNIDYKKSSASRRKKIIETSLGFSTLAYHLPIWVEDSVKKIKNPSNTIDK